MNTEPEYKWNWFPYGRGEPVPKLGTERPPFDRITCRYAAPMLIVTNFHPSWPRRVIAWVCFGSIWEKR